MTAIITADLHLTDNPRDAYRFTACKVIADYALKVNASELFILGDLTEEKDNHSSALVNHVVKVLHQFTEDDREVFVVRGNHDALDPNSPFFQFINHIANLHFISNTERIGDKLLIPHGLWEEDCEIDTHCRFILTHNTFKGTRGEGGFALDGLPLPTGIGLPVISGDVHIPQTVGPVTYVGAPTLIDFGDTYQPRILRIDDDGSIHSVKIKSPGKRLVQARLFGDGGVDLPTEGFRPGDIIKVKVEIADGVSPEILASGRDRIKKWAERNKITLHGTDIAVPKQVLPVRTVERKSDVELVRTYAANEGFDAKLTKLGESIIARHQ